MALLYVGTSGWGYSEWKGKFYPAKISSDQMLPFYARHFGAVELNTSSYRLPAPESMIKWRDSVPEDFRFALKVPRWITNRRQLQAEQPLDHFFELASLMGERCGPILVQLATKANVDQLAGLLELLRRYGRQMAFEFRHPSWLIEPAFELLKGYDAALCLTETDDAAAPQLPASGFAYVRLRKTEYTPAELSAWRDKLDALVEQGRDVYCFFMHESSAKGPEYAAALVAGGEALIALGDQV